MQLELIGLTSEELEKIYLDSQRLQDATFVSGDFELEVGNGPVEGDFITEGPNEEENLQYQYDLFDLLS